jgi:hypothetical protein
MMTDDIGRPNGNCKFSNTAYDNLTGYVTDNYTYEWTDKRGTRWRKQVTVINLGRPDTVTPADGEAHIRGESWADYTAPKNPKIKPMRLDRNDSRRMALHGQIRQYIAEHGPSTVLKIAQGIGVDQQNVCKHLRKFEGSYYECEVVSARKFLWNMRNKVAA